jgi:hypothetical protein
MCASCSDLDARSLEDLKDQLHQKLLEQSEPDPETDCWVWTGLWDRTGHGIIKVNGQQFTVARVAAWIYLGGFDLWDNGIRVLHLRTCSASACFNYTHLIIKRSRVAAAQVALRKVA